MTRTNWTVLLFALLAGALASAGCGDGSAHLTKQEALNHQKKKDMLDGGRNMQRPAAQGNQGN